MDFILILLCRLTCEFWWMDKEVESSVKPHVPLHLRNTQTFSFFGNCLGLFYFRIQYSVDLLSGGCNLHKAYPLTSNSIEWTRKVLTCMFAPTQNLLRGDDWQKRHYCGTNSARRNVTEMGTKVQKCFSVLFCEVTVSHRYIRSRRSQKHWAFSGRRKWRDLTWQTRHGLFGEMLTFSLHYICNLCILSLFVFVLIFLYILSQSLYQCLHI